MGVDGLVVIRKRNVGGGHDILLLGHELDEDELRFGKGILCCFVGGGAWGKWGNGK